MPDPAAPRIAGARFGLHPWRRDAPDLLAHASHQAVSRGLRDRFPSPCTGADGRAFRSGRVPALRGPTQATGIEGQACGGIGASLGSRAHAAVFRRGRLHDLRRFAPLRLPAPEAR